MDEGAESTDHINSAESANADATGRRSDGPPALTRLDQRFDAETRREAAEALGNPSSSMSAYTNQIIEGLFTTALSDPDEMVRAAAIESLYFHGDEHVTQLAKQIADRRDTRTTEPNGEGHDATTMFSNWLDHDRAAYRMVAATGLAISGAETASDQLTNAFSDDDSRVRARAVKGYARVGGDTVSEVRPLVTATNKMVRRAAVAALIIIGTDEAVELLARAARDGSEQLRETVVARLEALDRRDATGVLIRALQDPSQRVRQTAAASVATVSGRAGSVPAGDIRDRLLDERPFKPDGLPATFQAVASEQTVAERLGATEGETSNSTDNNTVDEQRYATWLYCELLEAADITNADWSEAINWLVDTLDHHDRLVADLTATYVPRIVSATAIDGAESTQAVTQRHEVDVEQALRSLATDRNVSATARERAQAVLRRLKRAVADAAANRDVEYVYVRRPADYTESFEES